MFPARYFPERYFPQRYFVSAGTDEVAEANAGPFPATYFASRYFPLRYFPGGVAGGGTPDPTPTGNQYAVMQIGQDVDGQARYFIPRFR